MKKRKNLTWASKTALFSFIILGILCSVPTVGIGQEKSIGELKTASSNAKKTAEDEIKKNNYDCGKIVKAIEDAENARKGITEQKEKMTPPKDNKDQSKEAKAYRDADAAENAAKANAAAARKCAHGLATSDEIAAELGKMKDKINQDDKLKEAEKNKLKALIDELIAAAKAAAEDNPCDPSAVRDAVNEKLAEQYEDNRQREDRPTRDLIQKWFEDNFRLDESGKGDNIRKKPRIEQDAKRKKRPFTHISVQPSRPHDQAAYFSVAPSVLYSLSDPHAINVEWNALQQAVFAPEVHGILLEKLQEEFLISNISSTPRPHTQLGGSVTLMPGIRLGADFGKRFEVQTSAYYFKTRWSGTFPLTVLSQERAQPQVVEGNLYAAASGVLAEADLTCFLTNGRIQPFLKAGARAQIPTHNSSGGDVAGVSLPVDIQTIETGFSPYGGFGARLRLGRNGVADLAGTYGQLPGSGYAPALALSTGWKFGGKPNR